MNSRDASDTWSEERASLHAFLDEVITNRCDRVLILGLGCTPDGGTVIVQRKALARFVRTDEMTMLGAIERVKLDFVDSFDEDGEGL